MTVRKTSTSKVEIGRAGSSQYIQVGSNPIGTTVGSSKLPLHTSDFSEDAPATIGGATFWPLGATLSYIDETYLVEIQSSLFSTAIKIKPSDPVYLKRGHIVRNLIVKRVWVLDEGLPTERTSLQLGSYFTDKPIDLTDFIGASGFPYPSEETTLMPGYLESLPVSNMLNYVEFRNVATSSDEFTTYVTWKNSPETAAARVRWRTVPRFATERSELTCNLLSGGNYTQKPSVKVVSDSGRGAILDVSCGLTSVSVSSSGSGYVMPTATVTGGGGTGASVSLTTSLGAITGISIDNGGYGYESLPQIVISDAMGTGASVSVDFLDIVSAFFIQEGGAYTRSPQAVIDTTYGTGGSISIDLEYVSTGVVDSISVLQSGMGYTSSNITITGGGGTGASAYAIIDKGMIVEVRVSNVGQNYSSVPTVTATGGSGDATFLANVDYISNWQYMDVTPTENFQIQHLKRNIPYEIQFLLSKDIRFRGEVEYSSSYTLIYDA